MEKIHIYHINDLHSRLEYWPRIERLLLDKRAELEDMPDESFFAFDIGDASDHYHPLAEATSGQAITQLLNNVGIDAVTIGNNEGVGETKEELNQLYDDAEFDVVLGNLYEDGKDNLPTWAKPFKTYTTKKGTSVGIFGLTFPFEKSYSPLGWDVREPFPIIKEILATYRDEVDILVFLSHLGVHYDRNIAEHYPGIDIILGAHTHHMFPKGEKIKDTLLAAAGKYGKYVGHVICEVDANHNLINSQAHVLDTAHDLPAVPYERERVRTYFDKGRDVLQGEKIAYLPRSFDVSWQGESAGVQLALDAMKEYAGTDAAVSLAGLLLTDLDKGMTTKNDLHKCLPHSMRLVKVTLTGQQMAQLIWQFEDMREQFRDQPFIGVGFRGEVLGEIVYDGISVDTDYRKIYWKGDPLKNNQSYTFVTVDFFLFSPFFPMIAEVADTELLFPEFIREVLGKYLEKQYPI